MKLKDIIEKRRSVREFKSKLVSIDKTLEIIDAGINVPLAGNVNTLKCIIVEETKTINEIAEKAEQPWITQADKLLVICSNEKKLEQLYDGRARNYAKQQIGATIQNMLLRAVDLGVGACWVGSYLDSAIKRLLKIPADIELEAIIAIGYANEVPKNPHKTQLENVLAWENWTQSKRPTAVEEATTRDGKYD